MCVFGAPWSERPRSGLPPVLFFGASLFRCKAWSSKSHERHSALKVLLLWHEMDARLQCRRLRVFFDKVCINQSDTVAKQDGLQQRMHRSSRSACGFAARLAFRRRASGISRHTCGSRKPCWSCSPMSTWSLKILNVESQVGGCGCRSSCTMLRRGFLSASPCRAHESTAAVKGFVRFLLHSAWPGQDLDSLRTHSVARTGTVYNRRFSICALVVEPCRSFAEQARRITEPVGPAPLDSG